MSAEVPQDVPAPVQAPPKTLEVSKLAAIFFVAIALIGVVASALLWQKLSHIQEDLARRSTDTGTQAAA